MTRQYEDKIIELLENVNDGFGKQLAQVQTELTEVRGQLSEVQEQLAEVSESLKRITQGGEAMANKREEGPRPEEADKLRSESRTAMEEDWEVLLSAGHQPTLSQVLRHSHPNFYCLPLRMSLSIRDLADSGVDVFVDTRPTAVCIADWNSFRRHEPIRKISDPDTWVYYPFRRSRMRFVRVAGVVRIQLRTADDDSNVIPLDVFLTQNWTNRFIVLALKDLESHIVDVRLSRRKIRLQYGSQHVEHHYEPVVVFNNLALRVGI